MELNFIYVCFFFELYDLHCKLLHLCPNVLEEFLALSFWSLQSLLFEEDNHVLFLQRQYFNQE
jgi:hypothetical protein